MSQTEPEAADQVLGWVMLLQANVDEYGGLLSPDDFNGFQADLAEIAGVLRDEPDRAADCRTNLIELINRYPSVGQWLVGADPAYRDSPGVDEPLAVEPAVVEAAAVESAAVEPASAESAGQPVVAPVATARSKPAQRTTPAHAPGPAPAPGVQAAEPEADGAVDGARKGGRKKETPRAAASTASARSWTPEVIMQAAKEGVTATIGLIIIVFTVVLVARSFGKIGNSAHVTQAKDLLTIMLGLAGAVVGYYFGRVPAEARATSATERADQAITEGESLKARTRSLADDLDDVISPVSLTRGDPATTRAQLQSIRDKLRDVAR